MLDFTLYILRTRWPEILGIIFTLTSGLIMPLLTRKSSNYKKINKRLLVASLLHLIYLAAVPMLISNVGIILLVVVVTLAEVAVNIAVWVIVYSCLAIITVLAFFWVLRKSKRVKYLMQTAKELGFGLYPMFSILAISSIVLTYFALLFVGSEHETFIMRIVMVISWVIQVWWLVLVAAVVWKASEYVYSNIKITMLDGQVHSFDCSPKVCRVYRNYIRIRKRDENGVVIQELQINEVAIKQIEYSK